VSADPDPRSPQVQGKRDGGGVPVDARGAMGVQVGEGNTQIIYTYSRLTWTDGVISPPMATVSGVIDSPYRGLAAFEERDAAFFFGREAAATQVLARMSRQLDGAGLLVVSGVSGAGKSSLLRAGVLPRLRGTGLVSAPGAASWPCLFFTPARAPLEELAVRVAGLAGVDAATVRRELTADPAAFALIARQAALAQPGRAPEVAEGSAEQPSRLLLVVDQFEQLFTQCTDEMQRRAFITALHAATTARHEPDHEPAVLVVLGVRADFEARCADYPQLAGAVQDRYLVTAMTERQLRLAITEPAKKAGSSVEDDLTDELLREVRTRHPVASSVGVLPLLSHALDQAWRSRTGTALTLADYERTGGIEGAVADSAQHAYDQLTPTQQAAARQVFTRLTACSDGVDTADRALRAELTEGKARAEAEDAEAVLEAFAAERLLILAAGTVEISHEILLTAWPLLRDVWLAETHADRIVRTRLDNVAAEWTRNSHDRSYLYTGSLLAAASDTATRISADPARHPPLSQTERDFLHTSNRAHRRSVHRRERFIAFLMALVLGLTSVAILAFLAQQNAVRQHDTAAAGQLVNESEALGDRNPTISKLLSVAAWRIRRSEDARYAMLAAAASPAIAGLIGHADRVHSVAFSPDGKILASGSYDRTIRLWNVGTHSQIGKLTGNAREVYSVAFSHDGRTLASGGDDETVRLWDVRTHRQLGRPMKGHDGEINSVAFSPDGTTVASGGENGTVRLWDVRTHRQLGALTGHVGLVWSVAFSPDGQTLASGGKDGTVRLWDVATQQLVGYIEPNGAQILSVAFSPDGRTLASGGADGAVRLWDVATQQPIRSWLAGSQVFSVAFSPKGKILASGNLSDVVQLWNVVTGQPLGSPVLGYAVAFSPDGKTLASGAFDHTVRLWDVAGSTGVAALTEDIKSVSSVVFSPHGQTLASGSADGTIQLWNAATHRHLGSLSSHLGRKISSVAFSPDGRALASGSVDGTIQLWNAATHRHLGQPLSGNAGQVSSVAFSPGGTIVASGGADGSIQLWNVATHRHLGQTMNGHDGNVYAVAFSPDGRTVASGSDGVVRLWDVATHRRVGRALTGQVGPVLSVAFSPDGTILASGGADDTVRLWEVHTHRQIGSALTGHTDRVLSVALSRDGKTLASGSADGTVRLWDVATHQQIGSPLSADTRPVHSVAFSSDGTTLASGSADGTVRLWDVAYLTGTATRLCDSVQRSLTPAEWKQYLPSGPAYRSVCP
jgi:WD40 repeat protein